MIKMFSLKTWAVLITITVCSSSSRRWCAHGCSLLFPQTALLLSLSASKGDSVRIVVDELRPLKSRYRVPDVVVEEPQCERWERRAAFHPSSGELLLFPGGSVTLLSSPLPSHPSSAPRLRAERRSQDCLVLTWSSGRHSVCVWSFPFRLEILCQQEVIVTFNAKGKLWLEALRDPPRGGPPGRRRLGPGRCAECSKSGTSCVHSATTSDAGEVGGDRHWNISVRHYINSIFLVSVQGVFCVFSACRGWQQLSMERDIQGVCGYQSERWVTSVIRTWEKQKNCKI